VANPNTISAKLHRFATKTGVRDSFAQGLEADCHEEVVVSKFERKNLAKVRPIPEQGSPNPNPMSAKLHRFATKSGVRDSFALGLEADRHEEIVVSKFERKKLAKVKPTYKKEKYFEKLAHYVPSNSTQSPITLFQCIETFVKFVHCS